MDAELELILLLVRANLVCDVVLSLIVIDELLQCVLRLEEGSTWG